MSTNNTAKILENKVCTECGWPIVFACCNGDFVKHRDAGEWDWWVYCSNKGCVNHDGDGIFQDHPKWVKSTIEKIEPTRKREMYPKDMVVGETYYLTGMFWYGSKPLVNTPCKCVKKGPYSELLKQANDAHNSRVRNEGALVRVQHEEQFEIVVHPAEYLFGFPIEVKK